MIGYKKVFKNFSRNSIGIFMCSLGEARVFHKSLVLWILCKLIRSQQFWFLCLHNSVFTLNKQLFLKSQRYIANFTCSLSNVLISLLISLNNETVLTSVALFRSWLLHFLEVVHVVMNTDHLSYLERYVVYIVHLGRNSYTM